MRDEQRPGVLDTAEIKTRADRLRQGLTSLWSDELDWFVSRDLITGAPIKVRTSAGLLPLLSNVASPAQCGTMMQRLQSHLDNVVVGIASTLPGEPKFESRRYWRGPVWAIMNWLIVQGCDVSGEAAMAAQLRKATLRLIEQHGFGEYFDPLTGESLGGDRFSWTAAILLLLSSD